MNLSVPRVTYANVLGSSRNCVAIEPRCVYLTYVYIYIYIHTYVHVCTRTCMCTCVLYASLSVTLRCTRTRVCRGVRDRVHAHGLNLCKQLKVHTRTRKSISRTRNVGLTVYFWQQERRTERKGKEEEEVEREWWRNGDETTGSGGEV